MWPHNENCELAFKGWRRPEEACILCQLRMFLQLFLVIARGARDRRTDEEKRLVRLVRDYAQSHGFEVQNLTNEELREALGEMANLTEKAQVAVLAGTMHRKADNSG